MSRDPNAPPGHQMVWTDHMVAPTPDAKLVAWAYCMLPDQQYGWYVSTKDANAQS